MFKSLLSNFFRGGVAHAILATADMDGPTRRAYEQAQQEAGGTLTVITTIILHLLIITLFILIVTASIRNLCFSTKTFKKAMDSDDTKILRPAKLGFWLTVIGTPCIIFFYIPVWLPLLILGRTFTKQANSMLNTNNQTDALEKLRMRQGQG